LTTKPTITGTVTDGVSAIDYAKYNNDVIAPANWFSEVIAGLQPGAMSPNAFNANTTGQYPNALMNGGFELWNKGTAFTATGAGAQAADGWQSTVVSGAALTVNRDATPASEGRYGATGAFTAAGGQGYLYQRVENYQEYRGRTVSLAANVVASANGNCYIAILDGITIFASSRYSASGSSQVLTVTATLNAATSLLQCYLAFDTGNIALYRLDWMQLTQTPAALTTYQTVPHEVEAMRCKRRFQVVPISGRGNAAAASEPTDLSARYPVEMAGTPTVIETAGTRSTSPAVTVSTSGIASKSLDWRVTSAAAGDYFAVEEQLTLDVAL
jgi:hypothetical protein